MKETESIQTVDTNIKIPFLESGLLWVRRFRK